jgi:transposase
MRLGLLFSQEVLLMLSVCPPRRKSAKRHPFLAPLWDDHHPAFRRINSTLPRDHHARWLVTVVSHLDLTAFRLSYAGYGSLAYPVELLLAFVLFVYSQGILSPAEWARRARYDDQCKWLLRGLQPCRSQLYTFRDRVEPFLDDWHQQLLAWAIAARITTAARGSLDGTFVAALASRHRLLSVRRVDRRLALLCLLVWLDEQGLTDEPLQQQALVELLLALTLLWLGLLELGLRLAQLQRLLQLLLSVLQQLHCPENGPGLLLLPAWMPHSVAGRRRVLLRYQQAQQRLAVRLAPYQQKKKLSKKDQHTIKHLKVSLTDPEAALGWDKNGTYRPLYNVPLVQATDAPLTLAWDVLARNNDDGLLQPMLEKTTRQLGRPLPEVLVDGVFVTVGEVVWCEQQGIIVYAPPERAAAAQAAVVQADGDQAVAAKTEAERAEVHKPAASKGAAPKEEKIAKDAFRYDKEEKVYYCPQGKRLKEVSRTTVKRQNRLELPMIVHRASGQDCQECPQQQRCTSNPKKGRTVKRYEGEEALERLRQRMTQPLSQKVYKLRSRTVELGYADIKEHRGLRVFRCFGRKRARAQAGLVILASNGLKIVHALQRRQSTDPPISGPEKQPA